MLGVADAVGRIAFGVSHNRRVKLWSIASEVDLPSIIIAIGRNKAATTLAVVVAHGGLAVFFVFQTTIAMNVF